MITKKQKIMEYNQLFSLCLPFRLTDMKWRSVTTRHQQTLQITKWRASSHKPTSFLEEALESWEEEEKEERFQWRLLTKSQRWVQCCVAAGWLSSTRTEHWNLKTRELQVCLRVPSCCSAFYGNKEWRLNVGKKLNNKCMKHVTLG